MEKSDFVSVVMYRSIFELFAQWAGEKGLELEPTHQRPDWRVAAVPGKQLVRDTLTYLEKKGDVTIVGEGDDILVGLTEKGREG